MAQREIDEALAWYESKQKGLGIEFLNYLESYFLVLKNESVSFQIKRRPFFRELPLKRFPFVIVYEVNNQHVIVYSVFNTYQDPKKKVKWQNFLY